MARKQYKNPQTITALNWMLQATRERQFDVEDYFDLLNRVEFNRTSLVSSPITGDFSPTTDSQVYLIDVSGGDVNVSLPAAAEATDNTYVFKKTDASLNFVNINPDGADTIDGAPTVVLGGSSLPYVRIYSDGSEWWIVG